MLMSILKSDLAERQNIALIRLFKKMKDYIASENQQMLGNTGLAENSLQMAQNAVRKCEKCECAGFQRGIEWRDYSGDVPPDSGGIEESVDSGKILRTKFKKCHNMTFKERIFAKQKKRPAISSLFVGRSER